MIFVILFVLVVVSGLCYVLIKGKPNMFMFQLINKIFGEERGKIKGKASVNRKWVESKKNKNGG